MIAKSLIETRARIHVDCVCASEYRYANPIFTDKTLVILVSQSGETADTIAALQLAKEHGVDTLAIVNVVALQSPERRALLSIQRQVRKSV